MKITEVRINRPKDTEGKLKAFATITFDGQFVIHGLRIVEGTNGLFVSMPNRKVGEEFKDVAHPIDKEFRKELNEVVIAEYNKPISQQPTV